MPIAETARLAHHTPHGDYPGVLPMCCMSHASILLRGGLPRDNEVVVSTLTKAHAVEGANFVIPIGKEPLLMDRTDGPSILLDWTVAIA